MTDENDKIEPMTFAERYHQEKLIKKAKKKATKGQSRSNQ